MRSGDEPWNPLPGRARKTHCCGRGFSRQKRRSGDQPGQAGPGVSLRPGRGERRAFSCPKGFPGRPGEKIWKT